MKKPPAFPDGPVIHLFDDYPSAVHIMGDAMPRPGQLSADGKIWVVWMTQDPEVIIGAEPAAFQDHTEKPWPSAWRQMIEWRAVRANATLYRLARRPRGRDYQKVWLDEARDIPEWFLRRFSIEFGPVREGETARSVLPGGAILFDEAGAPFQVPCDTDPQEAASGVTAPEDDR